MVGSICGGEFGAERQIHPHISPLPRQIPMSHKFKRMISAKQVRASFLFGCKGKFLYCRIIQIEAR